MKVRRWTALFALPLAVAVTVSACGKSGGGGSGSGSSGGTVSVGIAEPEHLLPSNTVESNGYQVISALFTPLVKFDDTGKPVYDQAAAESITTTDNKTWTIKLRPGFTFHDGTAVTADNYIKAWNYAAYGPNAQIGADPFFTRIQGYDDMQSPDGKTPPKAKELTGLKKVDDHTIEVTLSAPFSQFDKVLGYNVFFPLPNSAFNADGSINKSYEQAPVGQGPFKMNGVWNHNQSVNVVAYDKYPLDKPKVGAIDFKIYQDQDTMYNDLQAGNLDVQAQIPSDKLATAQSDLSGRVGKSPSSYFGFITVPSYLAAYKNPQIRQAISMAIDRKEIIDKIFQGAYTAASSWVSPVVQGARDNTCGDNCTFNPTKAKALWTQAGGIPGNKIQLFYNADGGHKEWVDAVCNQLNKNLGVQCTGAPVAQFADLRKAARAHTLPGLLRGAWSFDYPSIEDYLTPLYFTKASSNDSGYSSPAFDQQLTQADQAPNTDAAIKGYQAAEDIVAKDMPTIPMWFKQNIFGYSQNMKSVNVDLFANVDPMSLQRN
jgi:peptide/nickel transport system substrate-binding protein/oligopeptide transport system substrate-binding protein